MKKVILSFLLLFFSFAYCYNLEFFSRFNDKYLDDYIKEAVLNNHDLKSIDKKVEQYRYDISKAFAKEFPSLSVSGSYLGTHFPNSDYNLFMKNNSFILPFKVNWELDLLLKNKDKINSKKYLYKSELAKKNASYLSLLTEVASNYTNILLYDFLISKQEEILINDKKKLLFDNKKFNFGIIDIINLNSAEEKLNSNLEIYNTLIKNQKTILYNFALLLGRSANCINEIKRGKFENFEYQKIIPDSINSDLIYNRPDIMEIENKLKSAKLDLTVAKKDFFPSFNILGLLSFDTAGGGNFFSWNSSFAYLLLGATQDLFKGGEKIANLKIKRARLNELIEQYKQTDLSAIKEISNALNLIGEDTKNEKTSFEQLKIKKKNLLASQKKYNNGLISIIDHLKEKNTYNKQEQLNALIRANRLVDYFTLYKAVGGEL